MSGDHYRDTDVIDIQRFMNSVLDECECEDERDEQPQPNGA